LDSTERLAGETREGALKNVRGRKEKTDSWEGGGKRGITLSFGGKTASRKGEEIHFRKKRKEKRGVSARRGERGKRLLIQRKERGNSPRRISAEKKKRRFSSRGKKGRENHFLLRGGGLEGSPKGRKRKGGTLTKVHTGGEGGKKKGFYTSTREERKKNEDHLTQKDEGG